MLIGVLRLISLKSTNYVEHVSEYGIHWNFLFTIVAVKCMAVPFKILIRENSIKAFFFALMVAFYYQYFLNAKNLSAYILSDKRNSTSFVDSNKEGIFSCVGYLSIYLGSYSICLALSSIVNK